MYIKKNPTVTFFHLLISSRDILFLKLVPSQAFTGDGASKPPDWRGGRFLETLYIQGVETNLLGCRPYRQITQCVNFTELKL